MIDPWLRKEEGREREEVTSLNPPTDISNKIVIYFREWTNKMNVHEKCHIFFRIISSTILNNYPYISYKSETNLITSYNISKYSLIFFMRIRSVARKIINMSSTVITLILHHLNSQTFGLPLLYPKSLMRKHKQMIRTS